MFGVVVFSTLFLQSLGWCCRQGVLQTIGDYRFVNNVAWHQARLGLFSFLFSLSLFSFLFSLFSFLFSLFSFLFSLFSFLFSLFSFSFLFSLFSVSLCHCICLFRQSAVPVTDVDAAGRSHLWFTVEMHHDAINKSSGESDGGGLLESRGFSASCCVSVEVDVQLVSHSGHCITLMCRGHTRT